MATRPGPSMPASFPAIFQQLTKPTMNALIVGDDPVGNKLLRVSLELKGHSTFIAEDGMEAILFLDKPQHIDLIISDVNMPVANGYTFLMMARRHARYQSTPFIMYSASFTDHAHETLAFDLGADRYIRKTGQIRQVIQITEELFPTEGH